MAVTIHVGDALDVLRGLPSESVQCVVTSPPYFGLRDYGVDGQMGLETSPAAFIAALIDVFDEVKRVLRKDGLVFCNLGDSYSGSGKGPTGSSGIGDQERRQGFTGGEPHHMPYQGRKAPGGFKQKTLLLIPERFAIAMQDAGWVVRSRIAWCKTSAMPESVRDRPTSAWEHIWMFSKSARYFYDAEAVRQPYARLWDGSAPNGTTLAPGSVHTLNTGQPTGHVRQAKSIHPEAGANLRNFWLLGPEPSRDAHYAAFPSAIPKRCILAGTSQAGGCGACGSPWVRSTEVSYTPHGPSAKAQVKMGPDGRDGNAQGGGSPESLERGRARPQDLPNGRASKTVTTLGWAASCTCQDAGPPVPQTVLDPFVGSGTTALVADRLGRDAIGIELSPEYAEMARRRIESDEMLFSETVEVVEQAEQLSLMEAF